ncbi:SAM-dependent methyltransferase [Agromyces protaetiae]|uniref:SAM-dependent methyltransferase n=1 Tax=Agromyces protaetiae TaxID=2509455 RepID=A0A4P6FGH5_9MICO|nr:SAM-dependent methyltransferase [Agromyces protaetiae]QAY74223.1 SAM-dependent methyltransferase [Agromyces protaetiae]
MSGVIDVDADWLALREAEDARARSRELALAAASALAPGQVVVHDLGSGTGSMLRWLGPLLPGPQVWVLHDWNAALLDRALIGDPARDRDGRPISVQIRTRELARLRRADLDGADLVTASALLDVLTAEEIGAVVEACTAAGCPVLISLSVTGDVELDPVEPLDDELRAAFNAHQQRLVGGRRLVGPSGAALAEGLFREAGWSVARATSLWRLGRREPGLLGRWLDGWLDAALEQRADLRRDGVRYRALREAQLRRGALSATVSHADLLASP